MIAGVRRANGKCCRTRLVRYGACEQFDICAAASRNCSSQQFQIVRSRFERIHFSIRAHALRSKKRIIPEIRTDIIDGHSRLEIFANEFRFEWLILMVHDKLVRHAAILGTDIHKAFWHAGNLYFLNARNSKYWQKLVKAKRELVMKIIHPARAVVPAACYQDKKPAKELQ